jgi:hypothetical protein
VCDAERDDGASTSCGSGADIVFSPAEEGSNTPFGRRSRWRADPKWFVPFQYANRRTARATGTGAEIAAALDRVDVVVLASARDADGRGERLRETLDVVVAAAEPLATP